MFYIVYTKNLVLKNIFKTILLIGIVVVSYLNAVRFAKPCLERTEIDVSFLAKYVQSDRRVIFDSVGNAVGYRMDDSTYRVDREGNRYYFTRSVFPKFYSSSFVVLIVLVFVYLSVVFSEDGEWDYEDIWVNTANKFLDIVEENGKIHYTFRGRIIYSTEISRFPEYIKLIILRNGVHVLDGYSIYQIDINLSKFYKNPNLFPKWESITEKRSRLIDRLV